MQYEIQAKSWLVNVFYRSLQWPKVLVVYIPVFNGSTAFELMK